jgi:hypothetical protein
VAGYSGTPLAKKLDIKPGQRVAFPSAPDGFSELLGELPDGVSVKPRARHPLDVIVFFTTGRTELERRLPALRAIDDTWSGLRLVIRRQDRP